jgi:uncharacterized protein (TIGR00251 family)
LAEARPFRAAPGGILLSVRVTPRAKTTMIAGLTADADGRALLHIRLKAPPVDGAANKALIAYLAKALGLRQADMEIRSGGTARAKTVFIAGDSAAIAARLSAWIGAAARAD